MRLICPNCGAQYEVDTRVIPDTGRDVQCSNCGHTWFQQPAHLDNELAQEQGYELPAGDEEPEAPAPTEEPAETPEFEEYEDSEPEFDPEPEPQPEPEPAPVATAGPADDAAPVNAPEPVPEPVPTSASETSVDATVAAFLGDDTPDETAADDTGSDETSPDETSPVEDRLTEDRLTEDRLAEDSTPAEPVDDTYEDDEELVAPILGGASAPGAPPASSGLKDSVRDILRAEVEFDQSMRHGESDTLETQPDLGLEEPAQDAAKKSLRDRMARLRGLDPADPGGLAGGVAAASGKRRDLLPDIEEINSTLSASSERDEDGTVPDEDTRRARAERSGFRTGFTLLVLIAAMLIGLYVLAPMIAEKVPSLAGAMEAYVALANSFRAWLDDIMSAASARLTALLGQLSGGSAN